ncbi:MAG: transcription antitermination factor NusB [Patescibacteria group bacterium]|nr:transcription antitermination factor NusB [Patescibacteria group bacterium]
MKTPYDPRHRRRIRVIQDLFVWGFQPESQSNREETRQVIKNVPIIDKEIKKAAPDRPIEQINRIDLAILRLAIFELIIKKGLPFKVIVDEAIELAKEFGAESSPAFINGVLGNIISTHNLEKEKNG